MYKIICIDRLTGTILDIVERVTLISALLYCVVHDSKDIECKIDVYN
jgi:hypothetical protein